MALKRSLIIAAIAFGILGAVDQRPAVAQIDDYPSREVRFVTGFPPGSGADILVRFFADKFKEVSGGKTFIVENRPGAAGAIALKAVATAKPDGYTLQLLAGNAHAISKYFRKEPAAGRDDLVIFGGILNQSFAIAVDAKSDITTLEQLTAHLKRKGAKGSYATATPIGTIMSEFYKQKAGLETVQVNYRSIGDSLSALQDGSIDFIATDPVFGLGNVRAGRLRFVALSSGVRVSAMGDVPTMKELGYDIDAPTWWAGSAPKGTPKPILDKLGGWLAAILKMPETVEYLARQGSDPLPLSAADAEKLVDADGIRWGEYARIAKIEPE